jgi:hypothetical protein
MKNNRYNSKIIVTQFADEVPTLSNKIASLLHDLKNIVLGVERRTVTDAPCVGL